MSGAAPFTRRRTSSIKAAESGGTAATSVRRCDIVEKRASGAGGEQDISPARAGAAPALIVFGPTASGKSALAVALAQRLGGTVVNADSMQVYRELRVLTARPSPAEEAAAPHRLYGVRPAAEPASAAWWRGAALTAMKEARAEGRLPILCGGTGFYINALTHGLAAIPEPAPAARAEARALLDSLGSARLHARLAEADPATAARLRPTDGQRVARAWEVWRGTGRGLAAWQGAGAAPALGWRFGAVVLDPPRAALRAAIAARFARMLAEGAAEEVRALLALGLDLSLPAMRAHGVREIAAALRGTISLEEAERRTVLATGQYAKRQATWLRHHLIAEEQEGSLIIANRRADEQFSESILPKIRGFICSAVDAAQHDVYQ
ncbi:MAG: tRNA (adenosine(37)-N6)-dimethylallyltransferase MiaA [Acetobacteraceae bacterium]|nr:tRNA (adenosine(37)-N6)-dimethylallyltransferase MiaA [Acetobacteraceae bacterium]